MARRIVIDLYDHTTTMEILDIMRELKRIGIDDARVEGEVTGGTVQSKYTTAAAELGRDRVLLADESDNGIVIAAIELADTYFSDAAWNDCNSEWHFREIVRAHDEARKVADEHAC